MFPMKYNYGDAYLRHPCERGIVEFSDGSKLMTHDIFNDLPAFMLDADVVFTDSPWNAGNMKAFYTKAEIAQRHDSFTLFYERLFQCIGDVSPRVCYTEIGKEYLAEYITQMRRLFKRVTFFNSTYYHRDQNLCYVVRGTNGGALRPKLDGVDEEDTIAWVCENEDYQCIGDFCMGQGLVAVGAAKAGKRFVGTELNHKRLSVTIERVLKAGDGRLSYCRREDTA
jgi:hypothetical protein